MHFLHSQRPCPGKAQATTGGDHRVYSKTGHSHSNYSICTFLTSAELVVGPVTVEVVALAVLATVHFCEIVPLLAFTGAADAVAIVAADVRTVVFSAVGIQVLCAHFVFAALTKTPDTSFITPDAENRRLALCLPNGNIKYTIWEALLKVKNTRLNQRKFNNVFPSFFETCTMKPKNQQLLIQFITLSGILVSSGN